MAICSIIIPVRNRASLTRQCLDGLFATLPRDSATEIIVVDDGSTDMTTAALALYGDRISTVRHDRSLGFAAACNDGAAIATGDTLVFLHNDMLPLAGWLDALLREAVAHPNAAVIGSKLLYPNNTVQHAGVAFAHDRTPVPLYAGFLPMHPAVNTARRVQAVNAAGALFRCEAFRDMAGFDSAFIEDFEDIDLCLRLGELGHEVRFCPESTLLHFHSSETGHTDDKQARKAHDRHLFQSRWAHRLVQDDVQYYLDDELLRVAYDATNAAHCTVSPLLNGPIGDEHGSELTHLLDTRAVQVFDLLQENIRLTESLENRDLQYLSITRMRAFLAMRRHMTFPPVEQPVVSIVVPTFNRADQTYGMLESLLAHRDEIPFEVIIVDNHSRDETGSLLDRLECVRIHRNTENRGFGDACNRGAEMARGAYVCFLNSDTLVTHGWLAALVHEMESDPRCGAVGAKLVHPNGHLQEAGSIIWRDGSALGYGRGADPFDPEYCYARPVDYCSAACLLVRRDLFWQLGGFDPRYGRGYYEDSDLCMGIWNAGYSVRYAPQAVIFHLEHASSDRTQAGALMERNREVFIEKWGNVIARRGVLERLDILRGRDARSGKRLLVLDDAVPMTQFGSGFQRAYALIDALVEIGYVVSFLPLTDSRPYEPRTTEMQGRGIEVLHSVTDVDAKLRARADLYDLAIISRPHNAAMIDMVRRYNPRATIVYDAEAVFSLREAKQASIMGDELSTREIEARVRSELAPVGAVDLALTVSEGERRTLHRFHPRIPIMVWGDALPIRAAEADFGTRKDLLFIGFLGSPPNNDAVLQLVEHIFPEVYKRLACHLTIAGIGASPEVQAATARLGESVTLPGYVENLPMLYDTHRVFVAPHRFAAGVAHKVIEAMSQGIPCVISHLLAEQLEITDSSAVLVATDTHDFVEKTVQIYEDAALWQRIREDALQLVRERYDPDTMREQLKQRLEEASAGTNASAQRIGTPLSATLAPT